MNNKEFIRELGRKVKDGTLTWSNAVMEFNKATGLNISVEAFRSRYRALNDIYEPVRENKYNEEYETHNADGTIDISKEVFFDPKQEKTPEMILQLFGYSPNEWEVISWTFGKYEVAIKEENSNRVCTTVRAKIKPLKKQITSEEFLEEAIKVFNQNITPYIPEEREKNTTLDKNKLMELTGIELHLGKLAWSGDTGQDYDKDIAQQRFYKILQDVVNEQDIEQCDSCLVCIGNDFFNSDTLMNTTTKGTPQQNDMRFKKMFNLGLKMYVELLMTLRDKFNHIEVRLQSGNHDYMSSFYLYIALSCFFKEDNIINFSNDYKDVQCFQWGKCAIFFTHGETNLNRLIKSIPAEFYKEWGSSIYRELHLGHLHKEVVVDDNSGMITRRVGSPTGTDAWHYGERFVGSTQKYQVFIWNKNYGLENIKYINFENLKKKTLKR